MNNPKVLIIGGGLPALYAYFGARAAGYGYREIEVRANEVIKPQDVYYLEPIPGTGMDTQKDTVRIQIDGTADQYMANMWGAPYVSNLRRYNVPQVEYAIDPAQWFKRLWGFVNFKSDPHAFTPKRIEDLSTRFDYVIQTIGNSDHHINLINRYLFPLWIGEYDRSKVTGSHIYYNGQAQPSDQYYLKVNILFGRMSVLFPKQYRPPNLGKQMVETFKQFGVRGIGRFISYPDLRPDQDTPVNRILGAKDNILLTGKWAALDRTARPIDSYHETLLFLKGGSTDAN